MDVLGDKIYNLRVYGIVSLRKNYRNPDEELEDSAGSVIRVPIEHSFGKIVNLFPFVDYKKKLKINERAIGSYIVVCALLTNIHTCLYGSEVCNMFSSDDDYMLLPTLEEYMAVWDDELIIH